jgi:hypothetical protein
MDVLVVFHTPSMDLRNLRYTTLMFLLFWSPRKPHMHNLLWNTPTCCRGHICSLKSIICSSVQWQFSANNECLLAVARCSTTLVWGGFEQDPQIFEGLHTFNNFTFKHKLLAWVNKIEHHDFFFSRSL